MKTKKIMYIITNVILHLLGFPTLMIVALVKSLHWNSFGMYGVSSFTPLFVVLGLWVFVSLVQLSIYFIGKKHNKSYDAKMMVKLMIVPVLSIILLFGALDIAIPKPLAEGTQNTIFYEDVVFDYT